MMERKEKVQECWVGIDWGHEQHAVAVADAGGRIVREWTVAATREGLAALGGAFRGIGKLDGIAIETTSLPICYYLNESGYTVYPLNPKLSKQ